MPIRYFKFMPLATIYHPVAQDIFTQIELSLRNNKDGVYGTAVGQ